MKYKCTAHITYEFIAEADSVEEAEIAVFEGLADDVTEGLIDMEMFEGSPDCFPVPMLNTVDIVPMPEELRNPAEQTNENIGREAFKVLAEMAKAVARAIESIAELTEKAAEAIAQLFEMECCFISELWDALLVACAPSSKWVHYYLHSKKRRVREKYRKRLARALKQTIGGFPNE